jgi:hypothetical protein
MGDPGSLANSDSAAFRNALLDDRHIDIFILVIVVHNQDRLGDEHVVFNVNLVLGGYNAVGADGAIVLNYDRGLTFGILVGDIEPRAPS